MSFDYDDEYLEDDEGSDPFDYPYHSYADDSDLDDWGDEFEDDWEEDDWDDYDDCGSL